MDSLKAVVERNTAKRRREIVEAEKLLEEERPASAPITSVADGAPRHHELQTKAEDLSDGCCARASIRNCSRFRRARASAVERLSRRIVSQAAPSTRCRRRVAGGGRQEERRRG